uniref:Membrane protein BRI3 n=1 Tax=Canis lupus familiaris TaxID=9615 RepID=A0A8I3NLV3_CANLF
GAGLAPPAAVDHKPPPREPPRAYSLEAGLGHLAGGAPPLQGHRDTLPTSPGCATATAHSITRCPASSIVVVGGCPVCSQAWQDSFTSPGIFGAIIWFLLGFICCFALRSEDAPTV